MSIKKFSEIIAWKKAHETALLIYKITDKFPSSEKFGLSSQARRSAVSIPSNLAEGFKRKHRNDSIHFYNIAQGSLEELKYQVLLSKDLGFINQQDYGNLEEKLDEVGKLIHGWIKAQK